ncbi:MAG: TonB family protein [Azoarcus sp.]|jgi:protein TonB|nr:TonB family protein [Azoarcus sp.]
MIGRSGNTVTKFSVSGIAGAFWAALLLALLAAPLPTDAAKPRKAVKAPVSDEARARELEAEIARRSQAYRQRLRRRQIGGTVTESRFEDYLAVFRRKIACSASLHYPKAARGKTYGELVMTVSILTDGSIETVRIERGSGHRILDNGALDIARKAAPFPPFPPEIRADTDVLDITRTWTFTYTEDADAAADDPCA